MLEKKMYCRCWPNADGTFDLPRGASVRHKNHIPKLMFLCGVARPRPEYDFDGKVFGPAEGVFAEEGVAAGNFKATGRVKGVTPVLNLFNCDGDAYRKMMTKVIKNVVEQMWWFAADAVFPPGHSLAGTPTPEAGTKLWIQHDGASPHTCKNNLTQWKSVATRTKNQHKVDLDMIAQPAQSPDLNILDRCFFKSLSADVKFKMKTNLFELRDAVIEAWEEYPAEKLERCWATLYAGYRGILEDLGGNVYSSHGGARRRRRAGLGDDDSCPADLKAAAMAEHARLKALSDDELQRCHQDDWVSDAVEASGEADGADDNADDADVDIAAGDENAQDDGVGQVPKRSKR
jgi:hypothetical protein